MPLFGPPNIAKLQAKKDVDGLVKALAYTKDWNVPSAAAKALGEIGDTRAVEPLVILLTEEIEFPVAAEALDKLGWRPDNGAAGAAYWVAKHDWDRCVEIGASAVEVLVAVLDKRSFTSCWAAAEALGKIGDARAVEPLIAALRAPRDPNADANYESLRASGFEALGAAMRDTPALMRAGAAEALGRISDVRAVEPLKAATRDRDDAVRQAATAALGMMGEPSAVAPVVTAPKGEREPLAEPVPSPPTSINGAEIPAVAVACDAFITFDSDEALRGFATKALRARWPGLELDRHAQVEGAMGFSGSDDEATTMLKGLLQRAADSADLDRTQYAIVCYSLQLEVPPAKVWCMAAVRR